MKMTFAQEINLDVLPGPTHNYAGLAIGNTWSMHSAMQRAYPQKAALQSLEKMKLLSELGLPQAILPPHYRPNLHLLDQLGFSGSLSEQLDNVYKQAPKLLAICYSASSMWAANAATVSPSADTLDGKVHFTPANLNINLHRMQEQTVTAKLLKMIFNNEKYFIHHEPLPNHQLFLDEGAANQMRFCKHYGNSGVELFVHGFTENPESMQAKFSARQSLLAQQSICRLHQLDETNVIFAKQNPHAIDHGVFHNDVIAVSNQHVLLYHEEAFENEAKAISELTQKFNEKLCLVRISKKQLSLEKVVDSYFFNSQLVTLPTSGEMMLIMPKTCDKDQQIQVVINEIIAGNNPITKAHSIDCSESLQNGGGPACLRLRIVLTEEEKAAVLPSVWYSSHLHKQLTEHIKRYYPEKLDFDDLRDPSFAQASIGAAKGIWEILGLDQL